MSNKVLATMDGRELANVWINGTGIETTRNGWIVVDGAVLQCNACGAPITTAMLDEYSLPLSAIEDESFDWTCPSHNS